VLAAPTTARMRSLGGKDEKDWENNAIELWHSLPWHDRTSRPDHNIRIVCDLHLGVRDPSRGHCANAAFVGGLVKSPAKPMVDAEVGKSNCWWVLLVLPRNAVHSCSDMGRVLDVLL